ncbi:hypothetical protein QAD02_004803 [Eretmocerus hayati]|uniref:Uncharacterized protein n=1 Tax=Eretmocerus hayati TaxID=131215 RepID=A0ACC2NSH3_9HYME|nr:hypothetical protein QAD02_004803 [Eretmocerus hayati]
MSTDRTQTKLREFGKIIGLAGEINERALDARKERMKWEWAEEWAGAPLQGQGAKCFSDPSCNKWLRGGSLKHSRITDAIKMRTNTYPMRVTMRWEYQRDNTEGYNESCRGCNSAKKTLGHTLGACEFNKPSIIRRHDEIKRYINDRLATRSAVLLEQVFLVGPGQVLRPDFVVMNERKAQVVDITARSLEMCNRFMDNG